VCAIYTKHLCFTLQPTRRVLNSKLYVLASSSMCLFAQLQSRIHGCWAWLLSSTLKEDLAYSAPAALQTFPLLRGHAPFDEIEKIADAVYRCRERYMADTDQGLTKTYNALKDPNCTDDRILELRRFHEEMDRAVLRAYPKLPGVGSDDPNVVGWSDIEVPPFCIVTAEDQAALQGFEDEVIDRLFVLNEVRAKEEAAQAKSLKRKKKTKARGKKMPDNEETKGEQEDLDFG
jgi:hypothetical protein